MWGAANSKLKNSSAKAPVQSKGIIFVSASQWMLLDARVSLKVAWRLLVRAKFLGLKKLSCICKVTNFCLWFFSGVFSSCQNQFRCCKEQKTKNWTMLLAQNILNQQVAFRQCGFDVLTCPRSGARTLKLSSICFFLRICLFSTLLMLSTFGPTGKRPRSKQKPDLNVLLF